jgi:hypothetical protein
VEQKQNDTRTLSAIDALLDGLKPAQRNAVTFGIGTEGAVPALLIAAGAGTGKNEDAGTPSGTADP